LLARAKVRRWPFYAAGEASDYDGQVKTHEDRKDNGADNEIDGEAAIKLYDKLVKSQEPFRSLLSLSGISPAPEARGDLFQRSLAAAVFKLLIL
jgi:hypothetical protein